jgi:integrase
MTSFLKGSGCERAQRPVPRLSLGMLSTPGVGLEESYNGIKRRDRAKLFSVAADEWLILKSLTLAASSQRIERDNLKHLRPHFEKRLVTDIQAKDVSRYQHSRLGEGASPKTVNLEVGTLRAILRRHRVWAEIQIDVRMLPTLDDVGQAISLEEEAALLDACLKSRCRCLYVAVMLALNTGMRYSEIRLLCWRQVNFATKILTVGKSKSPTGIGRAIPLNNRILSVLKMWAAQFPSRRILFSLGRSMELPAKKTASALPQARSSMIPTQLRL